MVNEKNSINHEPFIRISKREILDWKKIWGIRGLAVICGLLISGIFTLIATGINPFQLYTDMFVGTFGTTGRILKTIKYITPLLCLGIGLAPAFKMKFWNIGAQGQMLAGALAATTCAMYLKALPTAVLIPLMIITGIIAGAVVGVIPAIFKAFWNTNETLFTLMLNYIMTFLVLFVLNIWKGDNSSFGSFMQVSPNAIMPPLLNENFIICTLVVLATAVGMYFYMKYSKQGYEIAVVGESENTARYAGINVKKVIIRTMVISGGICGLCGALTASGIDFTLSENMNTGLGFTAIIVAWLAKFNPFYMILTSFMMVVFQNAATQISSNNPQSASVYLSNIISGIILFCILASEFFINYKVIFRKKPKKAEGSDN